MTKRHQLTLTLRARFAGDDLIPGTLFASPKGRVANRILEATPVLRAGEQGYRVRIVCARVSPAEVLEGAKLLPWPSDRRAPRGSRSAAGPQRPSADPGPPVPPAARIARIRAKAPLLLELATEPIRQAKVAVEAAQLARARRVGRDLGMVNRSDYGPGIRLEAIRAHDRALLRDADVTVADAAEPQAPKVTVRRARRTDSLIVLFRAGTIDCHQVDAGERLRASMEASLPPMPGVIRSEVHVQPFLRTTISARQFNACKSVRSAFLIMGNRLPVVVWILLGGTIGGYAAHARMRRTTAADLLRDGLDKLTRHFEQMSE